MKAENEAEQLLREYQAKEDKAIEDLQDVDSPMQKLVNGLTSQIFGTRIFGDADTREQKLKEWKEKKLQALEKRKEKEDMRKEAYRKLTDFAIELEKCKGEKEMAEASVDALHKAIDGLKMLSDLMLQASLFWKQMQVHCKALGEDKMKETVEKAMERYDDTKRLRFWTSDSFKMKAVRFYAGWVALDGTCGVYMLTIQKTQKELHKYITENPSFEEAERNVKQLAIEFRKDLDEAQKAAEEKNTKTDEEMQSLINEQ